MGHALDEGMPQTSGTPAKACEGSCAEAHLGEGHGFGCESHRPKPNLAWPQADRLGDDRSVRLGRGGSDIPG